METGQILPAYHRLNVTQNAETRNPRVQNPGQQGVTLSNVFSSSRPIPSSQYTANQNQIPQNQAFQSGTNSGSPSGPRGVQSTNTSQVQSINNQTLPQSPTAVSSTNIGENAAQVTTGVNQTGTENVSTTNTQLPAQGVGELKHAMVDEKRLPAYAKDNLSLPGSTPIEKEINATLAYKYQVQSNFDRTSIRERLENVVRKLRKRHLPCQFCNAKRQCTRLDIRCGDRTQFSSRETDRQVNLAHHCNYYPQVYGNHVLIVDDNETIREFCKSTFALFLDYDIEKIITAASAEEAFEYLNRGKIEGHHFGLVIIDIMMPHMSGYELVNELYERNYNLEILLIKEAHDEYNPPEHFKGDWEIIPGVSFVSGVLDKPFHSEQLISVVKKLQFQT